MLNMSFGDKVIVQGYEGEVIRVSGDMVLVHFGGDSLHFIQEWYKIEDVKLKEQSNENLHVHTIFTSPTN